MALRTDPGRRRPDAVLRAACPNGTRTHGEVEAAVSSAITRMHRELIGRGPRHVSVTLRLDQLFVHLQGVLTTAEERLVTLSGASQGGCETVRKTRDQLMRCARAELLDALGAAVGQRPTGVLHDIAPESDEAVFVFQLPEQLATRERPG